METWDAAAVSQWLCALGYPQFADTLIDGEPLDGSLLVTAADSDTMHVVFPGNVGLASLVRRAVLQRRVAVVLNVYDFAHVSVLSGLNAFTKNVLHAGGAFHLGVQVYGKEWSFGATDDGSTGLGWDRPRGNRMHTFREEIVLGPCRLSPAEVTRLLAELAPEWPGSSYHLIRRNCCHFGEALLAHLAPNERVPRWVNRFARSAGKLGALPRNSAGLAKQVLGRRPRRRRGGGAAGAGAAPEGDEEPPAVDPNVLKGLMGAVRLLNEGAVTTTEFAQLIKQQQQCYANGLLMSEEVGGEARDMLDDLYERIARIGALFDAQALSGDELAVMVQADLAFNVGVSLDAVGEIGVHGLRRAQAAVDGGEIDANAFVARVQQLMLAPGADAANIAQLLAPLLEAHEEAAISSEEFVDLVRKAGAHEQLAAAPLARDDSLTAFAEEVLAPPPAAPPAPPAPPARRRRRFSLRRRSNVQ